MKPIPLVGSPVRLVAPLATVACLGAIACGNAPLEDEGQTSDDVTSSDTFDPISALNVSRGRVDEKSCETLSKFYRPDVMRLFVGGYLVLKPASPFEGCVFYPKHATAQDKKYPMVFIPSGATIELGGSGRYRFMSGNKSAVWQTFDTGSYRTPTQEEVNRAPLRGQELEVDMLHLADILVMTRFETSQVSDPTFEGKPPAPASLPSYDSVLKEMGARRGAGDAVYVTSKSDLSAVLSTLTEVATMTRRRLTIRVSGYASNTSDNPQGALVSGRTKTMAQLVRSLASRAEVTEGDGGVIPRDRKVPLDSEEARMRQSTRLEFALVK